MLLVALAIPPHAAQAPMLPVAGATAVLLVAGAVAWCPLSPPRFSATGSATAAPGHPRQRKPMLPVARAHPRRTHACYIFETTQVRRVRLVACQMSSEFLVPAPPVYFLSSGVRQSQPLSWLHPHNALP